MTLKAPPISEAEFLTQVTEYAELLGWQWVHFRPAQTARGWRTPVQGPLGKGWPDLILIRSRDHRLILAELKSDGGILRADQEDILDFLDQAIGWDIAPYGFGPRVQVLVFRPAKWHEVEEALR